MTRTGGDDGEGRGGTRVRSRGGGGEKEARSEERREERGGLTSLSDSIDSDTQYNRFLEV